jgi:hypothetical protein
LDDERQADSSLAPTRAVSKDDLVADNRLAKTTAAILKERLPAVLKVMSQQLHVM